MDFPVLSNILFVSVAATEEETRGVGKLADNIDQQRKQPERFRNRGSRRGLLPFQCRPHYPEQIVREVGLLNEELQPGFIQRSFLLWLQETAGEYEPHSRSE